MIGGTELFEAVVVAAVLALSIRRGIFLVAALVRPRALPRPALLPAVTVLVPARNERAIAGRLLGALASLEYPAGLLSFVLVCDGCTDDTPSLFRSWAQTRGDTRVLDLAMGVGKAAALNAALRTATTELVAVIDADLEPLPHFLTELVRPFADDRVAAAAAFMKPANADANVVTRYAAVTTWVHQLVTSAGLDRLGLNPPTLGAAAFRRTTLEQIGGFPELPAGEDVAASARLTRLGWRTRFVETAVADNTVVSGLRDYWKQHVRWARAVFTGMTQRQPSSATLPQRLDMGAASLGYGDRLVFAVAAAGWAAGVLPAWITLLYLAVPGLEIVAALLRGGVRRRLPAFLIAVVLCFAVDLAGSVAAVIIHGARRPHRWHSSRWTQAEGEASP